MSTLIKLKQELSNINLSRNAIQENQKARKAELNAKDVKKLIEFHLGFNIPFTTSISNYTMLFESEYEYVHFLKEAKSKKVFLAYNKLKENIQPLPSEVDMKFIKYYQTNFKLDNFYADKIYQVDIKSCYANILLNKLIISQESFDFLKGLKKQERLAAVGMLAGKKNVFSFDENGQCISHLIQINPFSDYFFYCVQETYKIMNDAKDILGNNFVFSWVDAIYFTGGRPIADKIMKYFKDCHKLESTFAILNQFEVELKKNFYRLRYIKDELPTFMNIPIPEKQEKREIIDFLLEYKYLTNKIKTNEHSGTVGKHKH